MLDGDHASDMATLILDLRQASQARITHFTLLGRLALELGFEMVDAFSCFRGEVEDEDNDGVEGAGCSGLKPVMTCGWACVFQLCYRDRGQGRRAILRFCDVEGAQFSRFLAQCCGTSAGSRM